MNDAERRKILKSLPDRHIEAKQVLFHVNLCLHCFQKRLFEEASNSFSRFTLSVINNSKQK